MRRLTSTAGLSLAIPGCLEGSDQHDPCADDGWMKAIVRAFRAWPRMFVDQPDAARSEMVD
jgi:hypothetical protein